MFKSIVSVAGVIATISIAASATAGPITPKTFQPSHPLPAGTTFPAAALFCTVDPTIVSVTLTKGARRGQVSISYEIANHPCCAGSSQDLAERGGKRPMDFAWRNRVRDRPSDVPERFCPWARNRLFDAKRAVRVFENL